MSVVLALDRLDVEVARRRLKSEITRLKNVKGRHSSLTTVYIPGDKNFMDVISFLEKEYETASNIQDKSNRKMVQDNLASMIFELQRLGGIPKNGLAMFFGFHEVSPGRFEQIKEIIIPPLPIKQFIYVCGKEFELRPLEEMTTPKNVIAVILMEAGNYAIGLIRGKDVEVLKEGDYYIIGKTRKGGQSARRYERIREEQVHNFYKHLAKEINELLLPMLDNIDAIVFGGNTIRVEEFLEEGLLDYRLREKVVNKIISVPEISAEGLYVAVKDVAEIIRDSELYREKKVWEEFKTKLVKGDSAVAYGPNDVIEYLKQGRVDVVMVSEGIDDSLMDEIIELAQSTGARVEIFGKKTECGRELMSFGGIAAILRW
ncbi:MAG: peptide chain release factor aRF-1 [Candidatus Baldrarchaeia archaeon]